MSEISGRISSINTYDYKSEITRNRLKGCLASVLNESDQKYTLYSDSHELKSTIEMAYAANIKVAINYYEQPMKDGFLKEIEESPETEHIVTYRIKSIRTLE